jgi:hypothetical protein
MSRAFQNDRELFTMRQKAEHAIEYYGKIKIGHNFYHTLGVRHINKNLAIRERNMLDQEGYGARIRQVAEFDPRWEVYVRRKN